ncbi:NADPH-dependent FMN reductase [Thermodesulfobium narugense DSM 14796]|uniref:NADPH-dependent FMN reductase n=1 Tax=Thermodesulfobium narugense DSM 14796 TaxID=747365 RepID=M1E5Y4_9BACT|nr:flavodoxin family protein [Thermodesulfobium narugense]AEE14556.1 NADPH-dependent FMN reductase [Thermodesulfobium narugense DSM 14796]
MSKNILVLTESPRKKGNSDLLADAFIDGAKVAGHNVTKFITAEKNIDGCKACNKCFTKNKACFFSDDFNELAPIAMNSDLLVISTPLYWFSFPSKLKAAIDKFYSFLIGNVTLKIKESLLIVCGATENQKEFQGITTSYELIANYMKWTNKGVITIKGMHEKKDILKTDWLKKLEEIGKNI